MFLLDRECHIVGKPMLISSLKTLGLITWELVPFQQDLVLKQVLVFSLIQNILHFPSFTLICWASKFYSMILKNVWMSDKSWEPGNFLMFSYVFQCFLTFSNVTYSHSHSHSLTLSHSHTLSISHWITLDTVSYTHLTLPTNREV